MDKPNRLPLNDVLLLAQESGDANDKLQMEFISLIEQAKVLYSKGKRKKGLRIFSYIKNGYRFKIQPK